jgi:outer membrane biosynthesis protein TonB
MTCRPLVLALGALLTASQLSAQQAELSAKHTLKPTPKTVAWGYYDAKAAPVLRVKSDDAAETAAPTPPMPPQDEKQRIIYVKHLVPPRGYPPLARQARLRGTIAIKLTIAVDGTVLSTESAPGDKDTTGFQILRDDAEKLVKRWTFGCVGCPPNAPFKHAIKFNYRLDNEDVLPDNWIMMDLPDEVTISTSPVMIDHGGPPPKSSKKGNH